MKIITLFYILCFGFRSFVAFSQNDVQKLQFETPDSYDAHAYFVESNSPNEAEWLVLFPDSNGINDAFFKELKIWRKSFADFNLLIPVLSKTPSRLHPEKNKSGTEIWNERVMQIIHGLRLEIGARTEVSIVGWGTGSIWAIEMASLLRKQAKAVVSFYYLPTFQSYFEDRLSAKVLCLLSETDIEYGDPRIELFLQSVEDVQGQVEMVYFNKESSASANKSSKFRAKADRQARKLVEKFIRDSHLPTY